MMAEERELIDLSQGHRGENTCVCLKERKNQREKKRSVATYSSLHTPTRSFLLFTLTLYPFKTTYEGDMDVAELTEAFKDQAAHPNHALLMQRVQELMGQGIDVSTFFATMVSVSPPYSSACSILPCSRQFGYLS